MCKTKLSLLTKIYKKCLLLIWNSNNCPIISRDLTLNFLKSYNFGGTFFKLLGKYTARYGNKKIKSKVFPRKHRNLMIKKKAKVMFLIHQGHIQRQVNKLLPLFTKV